MSRIWILAGSFLLLVACGGGGGGGGGNVSAQSDVTGESRSLQSSESVTYYNGAKQVVDRYCVSCHHDDGVAPFPLETHAQVANKLSAMVYVLESDTMPPLGHVDLLQAETTLLLAWLEAGAPQGSEDDLRNTPSTPFTYWADTKSIVETKCVACHEEGGIAPFPLQDYESVYAVRSAAAFSISSDSMPPWPPTPGTADYRHERSLDAGEKYILLNWLEGGAPEGISTKYVAPPPLPVPAPRNHNLSLPMPEAYTPTLRPDDHRCFAIEWPEQDFTYVTDVTVIPDQVAQVHHVIVSVAEPEDAEKYRNAGGEDGQPGWHCLGMGGLSNAPLPRQIGGWVPGAGGSAEPDGLGVGIEPGSMLVVQMHYNTLVSAPTPDRSTVLIETADEVERPARTFLLTDPSWLRRGGMPIEAGDPNARHEMTLPAFGLAQVFGKEAGISAFDSWVMHTGFIHMHNLGTSGRTTLIRQNGTEQVILDIRDWDFNWQDTYRFDRELLVEPLDMIKLECTWDNSDENQYIVNGVQKPAQYVEWGDGTNDEMCLMSILMTLPQDDYDYSYGPTLAIESPTYRQQFRAGDLVSLRLLLNNFTLHDPGNHDHATSHAGGEHGMDSDDHSAVYEGHYHVYLDTNDDDAEHLTAWDEVYYYQLPDDIQPGLHELRVNLRGSDHHPVGVEQTVQIEVVAEQALASASLIEVNAWDMQAAGADSLADHRPADVECPDNSWYNEDGALEVETGYCNYLSLVQPSLVALEAGDSLHLVLWHGQLRFDDPAVAHASISVDGNTVWEAEVDIPSGAEIYDLRIPVEFDAPAGSKVEYHLHNHGFNTWTLLKLDVER